jgi:hypothetical protein
MARPIHVARVWPPRKRHFPKSQTLQGLPVYAAMPPWLGFTVGNDRVRATFNFRSADGGT